MQILLQNKQTNKQQLLAVVHLHIFLIWQWSLWISLFYAFFVMVRMDTPVLHLF